MAAVTYRDIAKMADVSVATVSYALRNRPGVSADVRKRIQEIATRAGYRPNPLVTALMVSHRKRSRTSLRAVIAFVTPQDLSQFDTLHFTLQECLRGAREACQEQGFLLQLFRWSDFKGNGKKVHTTFRAQRIPGVIFHISHEGEIPAWCATGWENYAVVALGNRAKTIKCDYVTADHYQNCIIALNELHRQGYHRIGIALLHSQLTEQDFRPLSAYLGWKAYNGFRACPPFLTRQWDKDEFLKWFRQHQPEVIITTMHAPIQFLEQEGFRIPEDIKLVHLDLDPRWKQLSGIAQNNFQTGVAAAQAVIDRINRNNFSIPENSQATLVTGIWAEGSAASNPASAAPASSRLKDS